MYTNNNAVADEVYNALCNVTSRVSRNKRPQSLDYPFVVFRVDTVINSFPSEDYYINVDVYDEPSATVRNIEDLADRIDKELNHRVINSISLNLHFEREQRQYMPPEEIVSTHLINLRYVVRAYFK